MADQRLDRQPEWTMEDVALRFHEAVDAGQRLPTVRVQGYFVTVRFMWQ